MLILFLLAIVDARRVVDLHRRSLSQHRTVIEGPGHYLVQFRGAITAGLLRRLESVLGYEPRDYVPTNTLLLWIDSRERGEALLRSTPHIYWVGAPNAQDRHIDFQTAIASFKTQHARMQSVRMNNSSFRVASEPRPHLHNSFDRDAAGSLVLRLRVVGRNLSADDLLEAAQPACRTRIDALETESDGNTHILKNVHCDDAERVAGQLGALHNVQWVEMRAPHHTMNRWGVGTMQLEAGADQDDTLFTLRGAGQLLSMSDTGVQSNTCLFADSKPVPTTSVQRVPVDTGHRKIRAYWSGTGGDFKDSNADHGTHTSGTAVGSPASKLSPARPFSGGAPDARLVFIDLYPDPSPNDFLEVPFEIDKTLMQWSHDVGARVHSASWGSDENGRYTTDEQALDRFTYQNRYFLPLFAAGNDGPTKPSISSPSLAKNVLSVAATMNGVDSVRLAQAPKRADDDYSPDWIAPFSSRGSAGLAFRKPDLAAPGGAYIWSAASDGPQDGSCTPLSNVLLGLQGTSMATPLVAAAAVLVREYFVTKQYPNLASVSGVDTSAPTASLLRAILVASTVPLRGVYPRTAFSSVQDRIDAGGHGRLALDQVIGFNNRSNVVLAVLANEESSTAVAAQHTLRWCVEIVGSYDEMVVTMAYADYPSLPMARATLVNDLRLTVALEDGSEFTINEQPNTEETRSTIERTVVRSTQRVSIAVTADELGFGDVQSYSLVVLLKSENGARLRVSNFTTSAKCTQCALLDNRFLPDRECAVCGDGSVDTPIEQCDSVACCDPQTCRWLADQSPCSVIAGDCRLAGVCHGANGGCVVNTNAVYGKTALMVGGTSCAVGQPPAGDAQCLFKSSSTWAANAAPVDDTHELCCAPLRSVFTQIEFEHLFSSLAHEYAAAVFNLAEPGTSIDAGSLLQVEQARQLLETRCGVGFLQIDERHNASMLYNELRALNERCGDKTVLDVQNSCVDESLDERLCSSGGVYDREVGVCLCHSNRHPAEPDCAHLGCSGAGASLYDYTSKSERCVCLEGWTGPDCSQCASSVAGNAELVYLCVGVPLEFQAATQRHYLLAVTRETVVARLAGSFYPSSINKYSDTLPGHDDFDCWCRDPNERPDWRKTASHRDSVVAAMQQRASMTALQALSEPLYTSAEPCPDAAQPARKSAGQSTLSLALMSMLVLVQIN